MTPGTIGHTIIRLKETDSTNLRAAHYIRKGYGEGTVIIAESQTKGRGRLGRTWHSPPGTGLYLSIILNPRISAKELPRITLVAAVAAFDALKESACIDADIKWPNDLLLNNRKICGILTELHAVEKDNSHVIVGIGINLNTPAPAFPPDLADIATSVLCETGKTVSVSAIMDSLLGSFDHYYNIFLNNGFADILKKWKSHSSIMGRKIQVDEGGETITGTAFDLDENGALLVRQNDGSVKTVYSGDVSYV